MGSLPQMAIEPTNEIWYVAIVRQALLLSNSLFADTALFVRKTES